jgi:hypothetical protein
MDRGGVQTAMKKRLADCGIKKGYVPVNCCMV